MATGFDPIAEGVINPAYEKLEKMDPEYAGHLQTFLKNASLGRDGAYSRKEKEVFMFTTCCALVLPRKIRLHAERAMKLGATREQLLEAAEVVAVTAGLPGLWLAVEALDELK